MTQLVGPLQDGMHSAASLLSLADVRCSSLDRVSMKYFLFHSLCPDLLKLAPLQRNTQALCPLLPLAASLHKRRGVLR